jgi:hypothetical protein
VQTAPVILIHPPVAKPSEPPAGVTRLAGALRAHGIDHTVIDANFEGLLDLARRQRNRQDTWSHRAYRHLESHLAALRSIESYRHPDRYRRAVSDINRILDLAGEENAIRVGLANYVDAQLSPVRSNDLVRAAEMPQRNPFYDYYRQQLVPRIAAALPKVVGISINFLSQALCAFALIGMLRSALSHTRIVIGGGLVTSWLQRPEMAQRFAGLVDRMVAGPGESALLDEVGHSQKTTRCLPEYGDVRGNAYLSPGWVLPFSASRGCWWRRCAFCPERAEQHAFHPLPHSTTADQLKQLSLRTHPSMIHLLDNALSPALLKTLAKDPPGAPWYGFVRIGAPLDDLDFCRQLAASGCVMLKIGLESGDPQVLTALEKGIDLVTASRVLSNLKCAGIAAYVYLLFGTPAEDEAAANNTLAFVSANSNAIDFLNLAIFNLPVASPQAQGLTLRPFYQGDLALYTDFVHPKGWHRVQVRQFVDKQFKKHPLIQPIIRRDPLIFTSNHAAFVAVARR